MMHNMIREIRIRMTTVAADESGMSKSVIAALGVSN